MQKPSILLRQLSVVPEWQEITTVWNCRLAYSTVWKPGLSIEPFNKKINCIRIAPMKDSKLPPGMWARKVHGIRVCILFS